MRGCLLKTKRILRIPVGSRVPRDRGHTHTMKNPVAFVTGFLYNTNPSGRSCGLMEGESIVRERHGKMKVNEKFRRGIFFERYAARLEQKPLKCHSHPEQQKLYLQPRQEGHCVLPPRRKRTPEHIPDVHTPGRRCPLAFVQPHQQKFFERHLLQDTRKRQDR